jgi:putative Holliday junction resolvase
MSRSKKLIALDVGEARIGVAVADTAVRIAVPYGAIEVDGTELQEIAAIVVREDTDVIVVGYPRNQSGEVTAQTSYVEQFAEGLKDMASEVVFQDESLTSVMAEQRLQARGGSYTKGDIDAEAAVIILQDYIEEHYS